MIKAIFWILIFFFFISVLFYGIRFILASIANIFQANSQESVYPVYVEHPEPKTIKASATATHQLSYYDPVVDNQIDDSGDIIKCYIEHGMLWVKFKPLASDTLKTIKVDHIAQVKNLRTNESKNNKKEVISYFNRFL